MSDEDEQSTNQQPEMTEYERFKARLNLAVQVGMAESALRLAGEIEAAKDLGDAWDAFAKAYPHLNVT